MPGRSRRHSAAPVLRTFASLFVVVAMMLATMVAGVPQAQAASQYEIGSAQAPVDKDATSITINGKPYTTGMKVNYGDKVKVQLHWTVPNNTAIQAGDTFTYDLPQGISFESGKTYTIYGEDGTERGTFTVNGNRITATFDRADTGTNVKAYVTVDGTINEKSTGGENGGKTSFEFPGIGNLEVDVNEKHSLWAQKNGAISTDDPSVFDFVVEVHSTGTNRNVKLEDTMGDLLTLQPGTLKLYTDANCTQEYAGGWQSADNADLKGFTANIDHMTDGQVLYARYSVKIDRKAVADAVKNGKTELVKNKVKYYSDDSTNRKTTEQSIWLNSSWYVSKRGQAGTAKKDENGQSVDVTVVNWTITIDADPDSDVMPDATTIRDSLGDNLKAPTGAVKVTYTDKNWQTHETTLNWSDLVNGTAKLPDDNGKPYRRYEIKYSTEVEKLPESGSGDKITYKNNVTVTPGDGSGQLPGSGTVTIGKDAVDLDKKYVGDANETKTLKWLTTFRAKDDLPAGKVLTDTVDDDGKTHPDGYTRPDWQVLDPDASTIKIYTDSKLTKEYAGSVTKTVAADRKSFTITFNDSIGKDTKLYISYTSTVLDSAPAGSTFTNTVRFVNKEDTATHKPVVDNLDKSANQSYQDDGNGTPLSRNTMRWRLKVHDIPENAQSVTITDTLSHGETVNWQTFGDHKYVPGSMVAKDSKGNTYSGVTVTDNGDHTLTFVIAKGSPAFAKAQSGSLFIEYDTTFSNIADALNGGVKQYTNKAVIHIDGEAQLPDNADIWVKPNNLVSKQGTYDKNTAPYINYSVTVNPGGSTLNGGKSLTLTDTLGAALDLRMDSVTIADARTKAEVEGATYAYDPAKKTIMFTVPDARAMTITYKASVQLKPGEDFGSLGTNTIVLSGYGENGGTSTTTQTGKVIEAQGGISSSLHSLQIYKYADGDTTKPLNGARFKVERLNVDMSTNGDEWTSSGTPETVSESLQSGTSGYTPVVSLRADAIYRVTETKAPEGYTAAVSPLYIVFPGGEPQGHNAAFYQGKTVDGSPLTVAAVGEGDNSTTLQTYLWSVSNASAITASIEFAKTDERGSHVPGATLTLTKDGDATFKREWTTDDAGDTGAKHKVENLTPGTYTLTETTTPEGYQTADPITIVVTNKGAVLVNGVDVRDTDNVGQVTMIDRSNVTSIRARKVWDDDNNRDGKRKPVTFQLNKSLDGGTTWTVVAGQDKVLNESTPESQAVVEWADLPVREGGTAVTYKVTEKNANQDGYTTTSREPTGSDVVPTTTFTNTYTPETVSVPVTKVWNDASDADKLRPESITVQLVANGKAVDGKTLTLNAENDWQGTFTDLPKYENGGLITYTVQETGAPKGYTVTVAGSATSADGITITNTHYPTDAKIRVSKRDLGGAEIAGAKMEITGTDENGKKVSKSWTSKAGTSYEAELKPGSYTLSEAKAPNGYLVAEPIDFTVERQADQSLVVKIGGNAADGNVIVMTDMYKPTNVTVSKVSLTGGVGEIAGAKLLITGTTLAGEVINPIEWTSTGTARVVTLAPGTYTLHESEAPSGYRPASDITFTVNLDGTVTVGGGAVKDNTVVMTDELNTTNVTVSKTAVAGVAELAGATFELTGTTFEGDETPFDDEAFTGLDGVTVDDNGKTLRWISSAEGPRTFQLPNGTYTLTETAAPAGYDVAAKPITFTVRDGRVTIGDVAAGGNLVRVEDAAKSYTAVSVTKRWEDNDDSDQLRGGVTVTAVLYANGKEMEDTDNVKYHVELNKDNNWSHDWTGLNKKDEEGNDITYTVSEVLTGDNKDEYHASIVRKPTANGYEFTLYNIHQPDAVNLDLVKNWDDHDNQDGLRPEAIQVTVTGTSERPKSDGSEDYEQYSETMIVTTLKPNEQGEWKWTLENLPEKNPYGKPYTYSVTETPVAGYNGFDDELKCTSSDADACNVTFTYTKGENGQNDQYAITNTHAPETVAVTVNKVWDDAQNFNGQRPDSVTVWLLTSLWDNSNGWPEPQGDKCEESNKEIWGVSCMVLTSKDKVQEPSSGDSGSGAGDTGDTSSPRPESGSAESGTTESDSHTGKTGADEPNTSESESDIDAQTAATGDTWTYTFTNLPKYRNGKLLRYSVTEEAVDDYTATFADDTKYDQQSGESGESGSTSDADGSAKSAGVDAYRFTLSNRNVPDKTDLNVRKNWEDNDNGNNTRPTSIWVQLYEKTTPDTSDTALADLRDTTVIDQSQPATLQNLTAVGEPVELNEHNSWSYTFTELSTHKTYEVREVVKNGDGTYSPGTLDGYYPPIITGDQTKGYTITNTSLPILPETGGEGTARLTLLGLTLVALSCAFFANRITAARANGKRAKKGDLR